MSNAYDSTNNKLGLGTVTPAKRLECCDSAAAQIRLSYTAGSVLTDVQTDSTGNLNITPSGGEFKTVSGNLNASTAGQTIKIKQGSNACMGVGALLSSGTVTVATTAVATGDMVILVRTATGGTLGTGGPPLVTISNGVSFTITSQDVAGTTATLDTSTYSWWIVKAAA